MIHHSVLASKELPDGDMSKRRQLPVDIKGGDQGKGVHDSTSDNSVPAEAETAELCHNDDITDRKHVTEYFIHPVTSMFVYMKSESGGSPYVCEDCDYKTTVNYLFLDHMNLHYTYSDSDSDSDSE